MPVKKCHVCKGHFNSYEERVPTDGDNIAHRKCFNSPVNPCAICNEHFNSGEEKALTDVGHIVHKKCIKAPVKTCSVCYGHFNSREEKVPTDGDNIAHRKCITTPIPILFQKLESLKDEQWNHWKSTFNPITGSTAVSTSSPSTLDFIPNNGTLLDPKIIRAAQFGTLTKANEVAGKIGGVVQSTPQYLQTDNTKSSRDSNNNADTNAATQPCPHKHVELHGSLSNGGKFHCPNCHRDITAAEYPQRVDEEIRWMNKLGGEDLSAPEDSVNRGISVKFLVDFCNFFNLWDVSTRDVRSKYIIPMTSQQRCRFVDLPMLVEAKKVVGRAETFISHSWSGKFGDMVAGASDGADENKMVWIDIFAVRQWPNTKSDLNFQIVIVQCQSLLIICPSLPEVKQLVVDMSKLSTQVKALIPFLRVWCLYKIFYAASNKKVIDVKGGFYSFRDSVKRQGHFFTPDISVLKTMASIIDIEAASATNAADRAMIFQLIESFDGGVSGMNDKVQQELKLACCRLEGNYLQLAVRTGDMTYIEKWVSQYEESALGIPVGQRHSFIGARKLVAADDSLDAATKRLATKTKDMDNDGLTILHAAADSDQLPTVQYLVSRNFKINVGDKNGFTAVHFAACSGSLSCLQHLLRRETGADIDARDKEGQSALHVAVSRGRFACLQHLVSCGADVAVVDNFGRNALHKACASGRLSFVEYLLSHGANVACKDSVGDSVLHHSINVSNDGLACFKYLVAHGADVQVRNNAGNALLHHAVLQGSLVCVKYLLESVRADVNAMNAVGETALSIAMLDDGNDKTSYIELLKSHGADMTITRSKKYTPFHYAAMTGDVVFLTHLVTLGTNTRTEYVDYVNSMQYSVFGQEDKEYNDIINIADRAGFTALHFAANGGSLPCVKYLLESGADCSVRSTGELYRFDSSFYSEEKQRAAATRNIRDAFGVTALHLAARCVSISCIQCLIDHDADVNAIDSAGKSVLYYAAPNREVSWFLLERGADGNCLDNKGLSILHCAFQSDNLHYFKQLLAWPHIDRNILSNPLIHFVYNSRRENYLLYVAAILSAGADVNIRDTRDRTLLQCSGESDDMSFFTYLISHGADVNTRSHTSRHHLVHYFADNSKQLSYAKYLISHGANINCTENRGRTLLHAAAERGDLSFVEYLVSYRADVNIKDHDGESAMQLAVLGRRESRDWQSFMQHRSCAEYLIAHGADDVDFNKGCLLHWAAKNGDLPFIELLISHNANPNIIGVDGYPPLHSAATAASRRSMSCVDYLISHGADVDMKDGWGALLRTAATNGDLSWMEYIVGTGHGKTALQVAASQGHRSCVEYLVDHGVDLNYEFENEDGMYFYTNGNRGTILYTAAISGNLPVLEFLISRGANVNIGMEFNIWKAVLSGHTSCVECLITHGVDANTISSNGSSLLHTAIHSEKVSMVELLINHNANVNTVDRDGDTPLHAAVRNNKNLKNHKEYISMEAVRFLVSKGANLNVKNLIGKTALHIAAEIGDSDCVEYLVLDVKANVNDLDIEGKTALHYAAAGGHSECIEYLLGVDRTAKDHLRRSFAYRLDAHVQDMDGNTALHLAASGKHSECAKLLSHLGSLNSKNKDGNTPVHLFAINGSIDCLDGISSRLYSSIDLEARNKKDLTALQCAIQGGHNWCVKLLLNRGADIHAEYMGESTLSMAIKWASHYKNGIVEDLISSGAHLDLY